MLLLLLLLSEKIIFAHIYINIYIYVYDVYSMSMLRSTLLCRIGEILINCFIDEFLCVLHFQLYLPRNMNYTSSVVKMGCYFVTMANTERELLLCLF